MQIGRILIVRFKGCHLPAETSHFLCKHVCKGSRLLLSRGQHCEFCQTEITNCIPCHCLSSRAHIGVRLEHVSAFRGNSVCVCRRGNHWNSFSICYWRVRYRKIAEERADDGDDVGRGC